MNIVFNINIHGLYGLGATVTSLIRNCSAPEELTFYFMLTDLKKKDQENIEALVKEEGVEIVMHFIKYDVGQHFGHLLAFSGDYTTYGKLLIPSLIEQDEVLYLDSDLVIETDILELKSLVNGKLPLSAIGGATVSKTLDRSFFYDKLNWKSETPYFNAGVIYIGIKAWNDLQLSEKVNSILERFPKDIRSHDQTVFNAVSEGTFHSLPARFNNAWTPGHNRPNLPPENTIVHFIGAPKPWNFSGKYLHAGYSLWNKYSTITWEEAYRPKSKAYWSQAFKYRRSIARQIINRIKGKRL